MIDIKEYERSEIIERHLQDFINELLHLRGYSRNEDYQDHLKRLIRQNLKMLKQVQRQQREIRDTIGAIRDERYSRLLTLRYIKHKPQQEISEIMCYERSYIAQLQKEALKAYQNAYISNGGNTK